MARSSFPDQHVDAFGTYANIHYTYTVTVKVAICECGNPCWSICVYHFKKCPLSITSDWWHAHVYHWDSSCAEIPPAQKDVAVVFFLGKKDVIGTSNRSLLNDISQITDIKSNPQISFCWDTQGKREVICLGSLFLPTIIVPCVLKTPNVIYICIIIYIYIISWN